MVFPAISMSFAFNIALVKYNKPYPVASVLAKDPPKVNPLPVSTPSYNP